MTEIAKVTTHELAETLGVTHRILRDLHERDLVVKVGKARYDLHASVRRYCEHLRQVASGRGDEGSVYDLSKERARAAKEQADERELKNAQIRGDLVDVKAAQRAWADVLRALRSQILAVPSRVRQAAPHLTGRDLAEVEAELRRALESVKDEDAKTAAPAVEIDDAAAG